MRAPRKNKRKYLDHPVGEVGRVLLTDDRDRALALFLRHDAQINGRRLGDEIRWILRRYMLEIEAERKENGNGK